MFTSAGTHKARIDDVQFAEPKFAKGANDFDICIHVTSIEDPAQGDWWRGEVSQNYGRGNFATMTQRDITMLTLRKLGFEGEDLSALADQVIGKEVPAYVKESDDGKYFNLKSIVPGSGDAPKAIDPGEMKRRAAALFGGAADAAAPAATATTAAKPTTTTAPKNPFAPRG